MSDKRRLTLVTIEKTNSEVVLHEHGSYDDGDAAPATLHRCVNNNTEHLSTPRGSLPLRPAILPFVRVEVIASSL